MQTPQQVDQILALHRCGWGAERIARKLGTTRKTVRKYVRAGKWSPYAAPNRKTILGPHTQRVKELFLLHKGNAEVVKEELQKEGIEVSSRTVQKVTSPWRKELNRKAIATVRFETPPGKQMQIDFGSMVVTIAGDRTKIHFFVATLGYSRRIFVRAFLHERQAAWFEGLEGAFHRFQGTTEQVLLDNPRCLVTRHDRSSGELLFNDKFRAFTHYWGFQAKACAPYRARTKGKDERSVAYLKRNAIAGRTFSSFAHLENHLEEWMQKVDRRIHGSTHERPIDRFARENLTPLHGRPPFIQVQELRRRVHTDACVEVYCSRYSVPWQYIGEKVTVQILDQTLVIALGSKELARHPRCLGQHQTRLNPHHLRGIVGAPPLPPSELARPLSAYAEVLQ